MLTRRVFQQLKCGPSAVYNLRRSFTTETAATSNDAPLEGIRVLDLTRVLAGPYCTMILGDWGAEVIKVEQPNSGDETRHWGPPFCGSESAYFLAINRNKKSIALNFKHSEGQQIIRKLASKCDVLIENYIPGTLSRYHLGYDDLKDDCPGLIYCSLSGFGQTGPYSTRAGYDVVAAAIGGLLHITGPADGEPCRVGVAMTDLSTGLYACSSIMAALLKRARTGKGVHIDCNLLATQVATLSHIGSNYLNAGWEAHRHGTAHVSIVPYQAFQTSDDGYIIIGAGNNDHFTVVCKRTDLEALLDNPHYTNNQDRVVNRKELIQIFSDRFKEKTLSEWLEVFEGSGIPYGPVNNMEQVFSNEQVLHSKLIQSLEHPTAGSIQIPGPAVKYSDYDITVRQPPPTLGQHTSDVLTNMLDYDNQQIQDLKDSGVL